MSKSVTAEQKEERLAPLPEAARRWGVSIWTVRSWVQKGLVASNKLNGKRLIPVSEIDRLIEKSRVPARAEAA